MALRKKEKEKILEQLAAYHRYQGAVIDPKSVVSDIIDQWHMNEIVESMRTERPATPRGKEICDKCGVIGIHESYAFFRKLFRMPQRYDCEFCDNRYYTEKANG